MAMRSSSTSRLALRAAQCNEVQPAVHHRLSGSNEVQPAVHHRLSGSAPLSATQTIAREQLHAPSTREKKRKKKIRESERNQSNIDAPKRTMLGRSVCDEMGTAMIVLSDTAQRGGAGSCRVDEWYT